MEAEAIEALHKGIKGGDLRFVKLYMEYMYGKPKERKDITSNGETLNFGQISFFKITTRYHNMGIRRGRGATK